VPIYVLRVLTRPGQEGIRALRALLKVMLRRHGVRCVSAVEEKDEKG
jgi:hypothetical protein